MDLKVHLRRAMRALREGTRLQLVSLSSLAIAFLCLGMVLLMLANLDRASALWGQGVRVSVFLRDGADAAQVQQLSTTLRAAQHVSEVRMLTQAAARQEFLASRADATMQDLPASYFPASLEVRMAPSTHASDLRRLGERLRAVAVVDSVETYQSWHERLENVLATGRTTGVALALLVLLCACFVIGNTVRMSLLARKDEIEMLRLCGADKRFIQTPFLLEGAVQGAAGAVVGIALLAITYGVIRGQALRLFSGITGLPFGFVPMTWLLAMTLVGACVGAMGGLFSIRRQVTL